MIKDVFEILEEKKINNFSSFFKKSLKFSIELSIDSFYNANSFLPLSDFAPSMPFIIGPFACYGDIPAPDVSVVPNPSDNCGLTPTVTHANDSHNPGCVGVVVRTYRIEDVCGNFTEVTQNMLINDNVAPTADPLPILGPFTCYDDIPAPNIADVQNAMDNCGETLEIEHLSTSPYFGCSGIVYRVPHGGG